MKKTLNDLRKEIDKVDEEILTALAKRMNIVREVGKLKKELNQPPLDEKRWKQVIQQLIKNAKQRNLPEELIIKLYNEIHQTALKIEEHE